MAMHAKSNLDRRTALSLRQLAQLNIDSRDGFDYAAERIEEDTPEIAQRFRELSDERARFAEQLDTLLLNSGEDAPEEGSWVASMHRTWMNVRDMLADQPDIYAVVAEAERGEDVIKQAYEEAAREVSGSVAALINEHYAAVKLAHDSVRNLRDRLRDLRD
ncbi:MAG: PA2169 family four-helix-bundle protein [Aureliella sp.]